jgi:hypothetical protein
MGRKTHSERGYFSVLADGEGREPTEKRQYAAPEGGRRPGGTPGRLGRQAKFCRRLEGTAATGFTRLRFGLAVYLNQSDSPEFRREVRIEEVIVGHTEHVK